MADTGQHQQSHERYMGGSPEAERRIFERLTKELIKVQEKNRRAARAADIGRVQHEKAALGVENARLRFHDDLPDTLRCGFAQPGAQYPATVRLSNAGGIRQADGAPDLRGAAVRVTVSTEEHHDLLATNHPVSHARDAREFVAFAKAMAGATTRLHKAVALFVELPLTVGLATATRMRRNIQAATRRTVHSLAAETYWSRSAILWGEAGPVRYLLRPAGGAATARSDPERRDPQYLRRELETRLARQDVTFELCLQRYVDERRTPVEDGSVEWLESVAPAVPVATLTIPSQDLDTAEARAAGGRVEVMGFNPWFTTDDFRPLGNLNRARKSAYEASAAHRHGLRFVTEEPLRNKLLGIPTDTALRLLNRYVPWHKLPVQAGLLNLVFLRKALRRFNLIDTDVYEAPPKTMPVPAPVDEQLRTVRSYDGTYNDLSRPAMGAVGAPFGRNLKPVYRPDLFDVPNPVTVSRELLHRDTFLPATSLNVLAAAWIQFQVHDWVNHRRHKPGGKSVEVPLPPGTTWYNTPGGPAERVMRFADNEGVELPGDQPPILFANTASHWWDGSEVYGENEHTARFLREPDGGAKLRLEEGHLPLGPNGVPLTGFAESWWMGLSAMHTLFAREHNAVCDALRQAYPSMSQESVYHTARLVVSALIAKIHTVEWTPAILATEAIDIGLRTNWEGPPSSWLNKLGLWLFESHSLTGIPKTLPDHHGTPYSLTEDFVTVYRMHPLIPDDFEMREHRFGQRLETLGFHDIQGSAAEAAIRKTGLADTLYSFGISHPGAITLHNFPRALQHFERDGEIIDLSVVDLVRTRRRGVPRYNDFRAGLHKQRIRRFEDLSQDPETVARLKDVYRSVDEIDTVVGLFAENPPHGFGFSDTAFRIFILMATRRLQSDRFLTVDFRPEIYTPLGIDWVQKGGMNSVLLRHCPDLAGLLPRGASAFAPWRQVQAMSDRGERAGG
ncbi:MULTISPECIES: peroxidase family protein [Streptomyces]|uniref:Peroxidase n=2 Tax=Streptomyces TaxID=1883 RepID=A0A5P2BAN1_STRVZ|nr:MULTISPECIES: peroxidase family protein [Streptomyces]MYY85538.1 catalase [Streptomyces sp. SID335]NDZ91988.1 catalase [Streptomyces sp. SID10115]NEB44494.1 catalase [Streptomyces sp. SID339]QES26261.1 peroxidase [Streptomyces venezuelae]